MQSMIRLPSTCGWSVSWFTGEEKTITRRNGSKKTIPVANHFRSKSRPEVEAKAEELRRQGFKTSDIIECIW